MSYDAETRDINDLLEPPQDISVDVATKAMKKGKLEIYGLMPWGSNYTFLGVIYTDHLKFNVIYKPRRGERPLWDFDHGTLCQREVASYVISQALEGWVSVPPTIIRKGPYGKGMLQQFIHADYDIHYFILKDDPQFQKIFQQLALFDYIINNADRKGGHCLLDHQNRVWAIDHGLTFHCEHKLRTVIWEYEDEEIPYDLYKTLKNLAHHFAPECEVYEILQKLLSPSEMNSCYRRLQSLLKRGRFPSSQGYRDYPYPPV